jgi:hypothetical protein
MAEAGGANTWAAPRQLLEAARHIARHMAEAGGATTRAAPRQSLEVPAVCTAGYASSASSPTTRRTMHSNSIARPQATGELEELVRDTPPAAGGVRGNPQASNRSDVQDVHNIESP